MTGPVTGLITGLVPGLLAAIALGLLALALVAASLPARGRQALVGCAVLCAAGVVIAFGFLLAGAPIAGLAVPFGLPGAGMTVGIDALSAIFLLLVLLTGGVCSVHALVPRETEDRRALPFLPALLAAMVLTLLAADGFSLVLGFALTSLSSWAMILARHEEPEAREAAQLQLGTALFGVACLVLGLALLAPADADLGFAAMRDAPAEGWHASLAMALGLLGAGANAALVPLHWWLPRACQTAPTQAAALLAGGMTKLASYLLIRFLFDLCGPVQPLGWGVALLVLGAASAVLGMLRASAETDLGRIVAAGVIGNSGFVAIGLGIALIARAVDLPALASLALGAALLQAFSHGLFGTLLALCAGAIQRGAGSRSLARLGGLIHRMPVTTCCALVAGAGLAGLPPGPGFAGLWLLLQSVLAATRVGGLLLGILIAVVAALLALAMALGAAAAVRLLGIALLGRPRTPRAAAADEVRPVAGWAMLGLAAISCVVGLLPGPMLRLLDPILGALTGGALADRAGWLAVTPSTATPGYAAPATILLLAGLGGAVAWALHRWSVAEHRRAPAWNGGFAPPPAWLPFGDPATQYGGAAFAQPLIRALGAMLPGETTRVIPIRRLWHAISAQAYRLRALPIRGALAMTVSVLVLFLVILAGAEAR